MTPRSLTQNCADLASGARSSRQLTEHYLQMIAEQNPRWNAYLSVAADSALTAATLSDARRAAGNDYGPLDGVPLAIKDNLAVAGMPWTAGMASRRGLQAEQDAYVVGALRRAGAVLLGKTNLNEAALGADTDNPHFGACHNPRRHGFTPGGSSGGSAAAVAAGMCAAALGSDTLGSVRIPAAYCGVVGFKPSFGRMSQRGLVPSCYRLDHVGLLTHTAEDLASLYQTLTSPDLHDAQHRWVVLDHIESRARELRFGVLDGLPSHGVQPGVAAVFAQALARLAPLGVQPAGVDFSDYDFARYRRAGLLAIEADMAAFHAEALQNQPQSFSAPLRRMLEYAQSQSAVALAQAQIRMDQAVVRSRLLFGSLDVLLSPTTPQTAFAFGSPVPSNQADFTSFANLSGCPALSLPCGEVDGLPVGLQLLGPIGSDLKLIALAREFEAALKGVFG